MAGTYFPRDRDGPFALCPSWNGVLLASMGVSHGLFRGIYFAHTLSRQARPRASQAPFARRADGGARSDAENRHALHLNPIHRSAFHPGAGSPIWVVGI